MSSFRYYFAHSIEVLTTLFNTFFLFHTPFIFFINRKYLNIFFYYLSYNILRIDLLFKVIIACFNNNYRHKCMYEISEQNLELVSKCSYETNKYNETEKDFT